MLRQQQEVASALNSATIQKLVLVKAQKKMSSARDDSTMTVGKSDLDVLQFEVIEDLEVLLGLTIKCALHKHSLIVLNKLPVEQNLVQIETAWTAYISKIFP